MYDVEDVERFIVDLTKFKDKNLEITNYGEGLQRIFEIAFCFAYALKTFRSRNSHSAKAYRRVSTRRSADA